MGRGPVQNMASMYMEERIMTSSDKKLNDIQTVVLSKTAQGVMGGMEKKIMDLGQRDKWVCFDVKKGYGREEDEILWPHHPKKSSI